MTHTITTAKGTHTGSIIDVCAWQAEHQGAMADVDGVDVSNIDFDADDLGAAVDLVRSALADAAADRLSRALPDVDGIHWAVSVADPEACTLTVEWGVVQGGASDTFEDITEGIEAFVEQAAKDMGLRFTGASGSTGDLWIARAVTYTGGYWSQWRPVEAE